MSNPILIILSAFILLLISSEAKANDLTGTEDTIRGIVVTDSTWLVSSEKSCLSCNNFPWPGIQSFPPDSTFATTAIVGQPYLYPTIKKVPGSTVLKSGSGVEFFKTTFTIDSLGVITDCRFRAFVDDDLEIYLNGFFIAREGSGTPSNFNGAGHDLMFYDFGAPLNPYQGGSAFDLVTNGTPAEFFRDGLNELVIAVRNKSADLGGFSFRMDYGYVVDPEWVSTPEIDLAAPAYQLFPNPSRGIVNILSPAKGAAEYDLKIWTANGKLVSHHQKITDPDFELSLEAYNDGIYLLQMISAEGVYTSRLVKQ